MTNEQKAELAAIANDAGRAAEERQDALDALAADDLAADEPNPDEEGPL